jgi:tetratricopeptide (TPR) repeat protein
MPTFNSLQQCFSLKFPVALLAMLAAANSSAQAVTIISNNSAARDCYTSAAAASVRPHASQEDLATCTRALEYENLNRTDKARTLINRGIVESALEKYQGALADYNAASALVPDMPEAYVSRGNLWFLAEKYDRAISEYTAAMKMDFQRAYIAYYNRGLVYEKQGNREAAIGDYLQALKLLPEFKLAKERLEIVSKPAK